MSWRARITPHIMSITTYINPKDPHCFGVRNWWRMNLPELQLLNPQAQLTVQETSYGEPYMFLHYSVSDQRMVRLAGATEDEVEDIMQAAISYGINHTIPVDPMVDGGNSQAVAGDNIINFGYTESFTSKLEVRPSADMGHSTTLGYDDPGQRPRVMPRNNGFKVMP